jgi:hypothetical protein
LKGRFSERPFSFSHSKSQSGITVAATNFREDVTVDGSINSADVSLVKSKSGSALPANGSADANRTGNR